jgi:hypothetical protein
MTATEIDELGPVGYLVVGLSAGRGSFAGENAGEQETNNRTALDSFSKESLGRPT